MLDFHLHLVDHTQSRAFTPEDVREYARRAARVGVAEIAITEHFFRFWECRRIMGRWWEEDPDPRLRDQTEAYLRAQLLPQGLEEYVEVVLEAAADPGEGAAAIRLGLEVDYVPGRMDEVAALLASYPFDVLLGSVHWLGAWGFDQLSDPAVSEQWGQREPDEVWHAYVGAVEDLAATGDVDVLAHVDLVKLAGIRPADLGPYHERLVKAASAHGLRVEVSSAGWRHPGDEAYPAPSLLAAFCEAGVGVTLASDAHEAARVAERVGETARLARQAGYRELTAFTARAPRPVPLPAGSC